MSLPGVEPAPLRLGVGVVTASPPTILLYKKVFIFNLSFFKITLIIKKMKSSNQTFDKNNIQAFCSYHIHEEIHTDLLSYKAHATNAYRL